MFTDHELLTIYTFATVAIAVIAFSAAWWGKRQVQALRAAKEWERAQAIMGELRSPERITLLETLYSMDRDPQKLSAAAGQFVIFVSRMEWIAIMVRTKQMSLNLVMSLIGALPSRIWYVLGPYVESQAEHRGTYGPNFRRLVEDSIIYFVTRVPRQHWPRLGPPARTETVDLVAYLARDLGLISLTRFKRALRWRLVKTIVKKDLRMGKEQWAELRVASQPQIAETRQLRRKGSS